MKKNLLAVLLIVLLAVCLFVSCKEEPEAPKEASVVSTWKGTDVINDEAEVEGVKYTLVYSYEMTFVFYDDNTVKYIDTWTGYTVNGEPQTIPDEYKTSTFSGTYKATSETAGTVTMQTGTDTTQECPYTISGNTMTFTFNAEADPFTFTKV